MWRMRGIESKYLGGEGKVEEVRGLARPFD